MVYTRATVEVIIIRVGDDRLRAVLAEESDGMFCCIINLLKIGAVFDIDLRRRRVVSRNIVERSLQGIEVTTTISCDREIRGRSWSG